MKKDRNTCCTDDKGPVDKLTWEQSTPETFRVYLSLKTENIWGYDIRPDGRSLVLSLKYPPVFDPAAEKPLTGLKIAIEAGQGGSGLGAIGLSGLVEKDINLDLLFRLGELCTAMGAEVLQVRDRDVDMTLIEKCDKALKAGAKMLISIHANAGGRGYLYVTGTSTYWHNPFWAPLAQTIYDKMLEDYFMIILGVLNKSKNPGAFASRLLTCRQEV